MFKACATRFPLVKYRLRHHIEYGTVFSITCIMAVICQQAPSIGPAATPISARNGAARRDEGFTSVGSSNGGVDVYMVAFICVGTVVMLLAAGFVWSLVNSMRLRKQAIASGVITEHLSAKEKKRQECKQTLHSIHEDSLDGQKPDQTEHPIKEGSLIGCDDQTSLAISV